MKPCCTPSVLAQSVSAPLASAAPTSHAVAAAAAGTAVTSNSVLVTVPGGSFVMGTDSHEGFAEDGEGPARAVQISGFSLAETTVTNVEFREFVRATRYITEAEQLGSSFVFYLQVPALQRATQRPASRELVWWLDVEGACWQRPNGPGSNILNVLEHPVVHVTWNDVSNYCAWAGVRLPTEAEWEYAAGAGQSSPRYPWGDDLQPEGEPVCNIWQGEFPGRPSDSWVPRPLAAKSYKPNAWGFYQQAGNVWEWVADSFHADYHTATSNTDPLDQRPSTNRSMRGGSFLCHESYCNRYRLAARGSNTPNTSTSNIGFRVAK